MIYEIKLYYHYNPSVLSINDYEETIKYALNEIGVNYILYHNICDSVDERLSDNDISKGDLEFILQLNNREKVLEIGRILSETKIISKGQLFNSTKLKLIRYKGI